MCEVISVMHTITGLDSLNCHIARYPSCVSIQMLIVEIWQKYTSIIRLKCV